MTALILQQYRPKDVAKILGISLSTFWRLVSEGKLTTKKLTTRTTTVSAEDLSAFINGGK